MEKFPFNDFEEEKPSYSRRDVLKAAVGGVAALWAGETILKNKKPEEAESEVLRIEQEVAEDIVSEDSIVDQPAQRRPVENLNEERKEIGSAELKRIKPEMIYFEKYMPTIENLRFPDTSSRNEHLDLPEGVGIYGASGQESKLIRVLRYKNITDAVEDRYNLPSGVLLAMIMEESTGVDLLPNARNDGGFGLSHMQGATASEYGLHTFEGCNCMVCGPNKEFGRENLLCGL